MAASSHSPPKTSSEQVAMTSEKRPRSLESKSSNDKAPVEPTNSYKRKNKNNFNMPKPVLPKSREDNIPDQIFKM